MTNTWEENSLYTVRRPQTRPPCRQWHEGLAMLSYLPHCLTPNRKSHQEGGCIYCPQVALTASRPFDIERRVEASCQQPSLAGPPDLLRFQVWTLPRPSWIVVQPASSVSRNKNRKLGFSPSYFVFVSVIHRHSLILHNLLHFPFNQRTFKHRGTFLWNNLRLHNQYSKLFKKFLINQVV